MTDMDRKVDHPNYECTIERSPGQYIVCFKVGEYINPPKEARAAEARIFEIISAIPKDDMNLLREWGGSVIFHTMNSRLVNPEITDEMRLSFREAAEKAYPYPQWRVRDSWDNSTNGRHGFSVLMVKNERT